MSSNTDMDGCFIHLNVGKTILNESKGGYQDLCRSEILCVKVKDQTNKLRNTFTKSLMGRRLVVCKIFKEVLQPDLTNGQMNLTMVEGMNHYYIYGGYL